MRRSSIDSKTCWDIFLIICCTCNLSEDCYWNIGFLWMNCLFMVQLSLISFHGIIDNISIVWRLAKLYRLKCGLFSPLTTINSKIHFQLSAYKKYESSAERVNRNLDWKKSLKHNSDKKSWQILGTCRNKFEFVR